jgi:hypothetical protein
LAPFAELSNRSFIASFAHPRGGGDPELWKTRCPRAIWIPACAGMSGAENRQLPQDLLPERSENTAVLPDRQ